MPPPPNPNARRRNKRAAGFDVLPPDGRRGVVPRLPATPEGSKDPWDPLVVEAWHEWWRSPMATRWLDAEVAALTVGAQLLQHALSGSIDHAREYRLFSDRFGLSPLARLRNRWLIGDEGEAGTAETPADADVVQLRVVGGEPLEDDDGDG